LLAICADPRLKIFGERKVNELRSWFDERLEQAIKAAEEEGKSPENQGKNIHTCNI